MEHEESKALFGHGPLHLSHVVLARRSHRVSRDYRSIAPQGNVPVVALLEGGVLSESIAVLVAALFDGRALITGIALGSHQIGFRASGYRPLDVEITIDGAAGNRSCSSLSGHRSSGVTDPPCARAIASTLRRTSSSSVDQLETEIRIPATPRHVVMLG